MRYVLPLLVLLTGCTSTRTVEMVTTSDRNRINERTGQQTTFLTLRGDRERFVRSLHVAADSATWIDATSGEARAAPMENVEAVRLLRRGPGTQRGALVGGGIGLALGLLMSAAEGEPRGFRPHFGPALWVPLGVIPGATIGGVVATDRSTEYRMGQGTASVGVREGSAVRSGEPEGACGGPPLACAARPPGLRAVEPTAAGRP